jgi:hypothetical protein
MKVRVLIAYKANKILPTGYRVDHDPDVLTLLRPDGSAVTYFPTPMANLERIREEAEEDLIRTYLCRW